MNEINKNIDENPESHSESISIKPKKKVFKVIAKTLLVILLSVVVLFGVFILLTQTKGFRSWLSGIIVNIANKELIGKIEFSDIGINPFTGRIELDDFKLFAAGDTVVSLAKLEVSLKIRPLLSQKAIINHIYLNSPKIKILRSLTDSTWNVEHIAKPSEDTTTSPPPEWFIDLNKLKIDNAEFCMIDSVNVTNFSKSEMINFLNLQLRDLNIEIEAKADLKKSKFDISINNLSLLEKNTNFILEKLKSNISVDTNKVKISKFEIKTPDNKIDFTLVADSLNVFSISSDEDLKKSIIDLDFRAKVESDKDIKRFAPVDMKINDRVDLEFDLKGNFNSMVLSNFLLETNITKISLDASVKNVLDSNLSFYTNITDSKLYFNDIIQFIPKEVIPALPK